MRAHPPMPRLRLAAIPLFAVLVPAFSVFAPACDDTPRGVQGIDYYDEAGLVEDDASDSSLPDVHGPCQETPDPTGYCTQLGGAGTLYTHLIVCIDGADPTLLDCETSDASASSGNAATDYCCTTGLL